MFSDVLHKGDLNDGFNGAINGMSIVRWFKFTLKPPYSIAHDKL